MTRTKLKDRTLPDYTKGEEIFNSTSHLFGAALGIAALALCIVRAALHGDAWDIVGSAIYGASLIILYTVSGVYHGLRPGMAKKVMQILDHCVIYILIAGTYTPILFSAIRPVSPVCAWVLFGSVWGIAAVAAVFTAIDLKKYAILSMICYLGMGWCVVLAIKVVLSAIQPMGFYLLLAGGISYTLGAVLYGIGSRHRYIHSVFHLFVVAGSVLHFFCIYLYVI